MKRQRIGLIAAIGAALMGGGSVEVDANGKAKHMSRKERRRSKNNPSIHCRSKYKPHQGLQEKQRRMAQKQRRMDKSK